jgi:hypothetical protein
LGYPVPSIGHVGLMTILHPVAGWLATAAEAVSAMMAATREGKRRASPCSRSGHAVAHSTSRVKSSALL